MLEDDDTRHWKAMQEFADMGVRVHTRVTTLAGGRVLCAAYNDLKCSDRNCESLHRCSFAVPVPGKYTRHGLSSFLACGALHACKARHTCWSQQ